MYFILDVHLKFVWCSCKLCSVGYTSTFRQLQSATLILTTARCHHVFVVELPQRRPSRRYLQRRTCSVWIVWGFQMSVGCHMPSIDRSRRFSWFHDIPVNSVGGMLLSGTDQRGVMWQFGYVQAIPAPPVDSWVSLDDIDDRWMHYPDHLAPTCEMCVVPGQCALDYIDCFFCISHPLMIATQPSNPLPNAHAAQPRHVPQVPDDLARSNVDEPIHVVVSVTIWLDVWNVIYFKFLILICLICLFSI